MWFSAILEPTLVAVFVLPPRHTIMMDDTPRFVSSQRGQVLAIHTSLIITMMCSLD